MEKSLDQLGLPLTTPLVMDLLQRLSLEEKIAFRFFTWAATQPNYAHEPPAYNQMIDILSSTKYKVKQFRIVCDMLDYMKRSNKNSVPVEVLLLILRQYTEKYLTHLQKFAKKKRIRVKTQPEINAFNLLLDALCKCSLVEDAQALFKRMKKRVKPDANSYNILFFGWCRVRNPKRGMRVLEEMIQLGHTPDNFTYNTAIDTFCKAGMVSEAAELFEFMRTNGSTTSSPTAKTYAIMIVALIHNNRMQECFELIGHMINSGCLPDVSTYKEMIEGMCLAGKIEEAYKFLEEMGNKGYPPDVVTYNCFLKVLCDNQKSDEALRLYQRMIDVGCMPSVQTYNMLISMFFQMGDVDGVFGTWQEMDKRGCAHDIETYCIMIDGLFSCNRVEDACLLLEDVVNKGLKLPYPKFDSFLMQLSAIGNIQAIHKLSEHMRKFYNPSMARRFALNQKRMSMRLRGKKPIMSKTLNLIKTNASNPKVLIVAGITVAGIIVLAETSRRRRKAMIFNKEDFGAFLERFELIPFPQPPPPAAKLPLSGLTFAIKDIFDVEGYITGFGNPDWQRTHEPADKTAVAVTALLKNGGSSSGSAVAVAAELVDFALGTDTIGCMRIPASFCGILGFRPSHGAVSTVGLVPNSQSLDAIGCFARDPSVLHRVGHVLLQLKAAEPRRVRRVVFADDLFQLSKVPKEKTVYVICKAIEKLSGYQPPKHIKFVQYIASNVPSLKGFGQHSTNLQNGISTLKALSSVMMSLQSYEFKTNHEEWVKDVKPRLGPEISDHVRAAINTTYENVKDLYKVRTEMRAALQSLLKDDGILVIPTVADSALKRNSKKGYSAEFHDRAYILSSIASMSGGCQVSVPLGKHEDCPVSVSFITYHGADKFLLDTVLDMYASLQEQVSIASNSEPLPDVNDMDASELLKEKGNAAFKGMQWNKAVKYYSEAIKLNGTNAAYYNNRAAAYLALGCFQQAEEDCSKAISLDKKNVKAYLRRGTARESLLCYKGALEDFKYALVLEPQNKVANLAEKRLRKLIT
ncbi:Amidase [Corchorus olitorius]|uniref:Amidase n=1 Tax=Corchorus olitorius TaxID=93759 RepID=A0A1R3KF79_9ROSI|nr:Amidase [Corchorus olitorius]